MVGFWCSGFWWERMDQFRPLILQPGSRTPSGPSLGKEHQNSRARVQSINSSSIIRLVSIKFGIWEVKFFTQSIGQGLCTRMHTWTRHEKLHGRTAKTQENRIMEINAFTTYKTNPRPEKSAVNTFCDTNARNAVLCYARLLIPSCFICVPVHTEPRRSENCANMACSATRCMRENAVRELPGILHRRGVVNNLSSWS